MKIYLIGSGSHAEAVLHTLSQSGQHEVVGLIDETLPACSNRHGFRTFPAPPLTADVACFIAVGDNAVRKRLSGISARYVNVMDKSARTDYNDGVGCYFAASCHVGPNCTIGNFTIINTGVIFEHHSYVGSFSHLAPGVVTGGRVRIGSLTTIGLHATIRDGVTIGNNVTIGMGSVVTKDIPDNCAAWGNPCRVQRKQ